MGYTFIDLQNIVRKNVKFTSYDVDITQVLKDAINLAIYETARERKWAELLVVNFEPDLTGIDNDGKTLIPASEKMMIIERVQFKHNNSSLTWKLAERSGAVPPAPFFGYPRSYTQIAGTPIGLYIEPYESIQPTADHIYVDYWKAPDVLLFDADAPVSSMWDSEIVKKAESTMLIYFNKIEQAKAVLQSAVPKPTTTNES